MTERITPQSRCRFGIATADITPPVGIYQRMWGAAAHDRSEGVHRPLVATAMYFGRLDASQHPVGQQLLIAVDHCLLGAEEVRRILDCAAADSGMPPESIAITFSHTHAAGLLNLDRQHLPGGELIPGYLAQLESTIAQLGVAARSQACQADIVYGTGRCQLAAHRDYLDRELNEYVCGYNPHETADDTVVVARVTSREGHLLATIVNYACHPTTLAWDNRLISPDFPGAMREVIQQTTGAPCVFLQGASGDLGPVEGFVGDTAIADRNGRQLAYAVLSVFESLPHANTTYVYSGKVVSGAAIGTWTHLPAGPGRLKQTSIWGNDCRAVPLRYREDLPDIDRLALEHEDLLTQEQTARTEGQLEQARELRAMAERAKRMLGRLQGMPAGERFALEVSIWRVGDAVWLAVQGEPYSLLQRRLREQFPDTPIVIATIANGWGPSYLPTRESYGRGIYQESIAALAPGCLETLIDELVGRIETLIRTTTSAIR